MTEAPRILVLFGNVPLHGQERGNIEAADGLRRAGCEVLFLIRQEWTHDTIQAELRRRGLPFVFVPYFDAVRSGLSLTVWWSNAKGIVGGSLQLLRLIRAFRATHIQAGSASNVLNFLPGLLLTRLPLIFRAGDVPSLHHWMWRRIWQFTRWRVMRFVCISQFIQRTIIGLGVPQIKTSVIYSIPPGRQNSAASVQQKPRGIGTTFGYIGQIIPEKGVAELVDAAIVHCRMYPNSRFLIAGDVSWNNPFASGLIARVSAVGLGKSIEFIGYVSNVSAFFLNVDVHICPSICPEGLGNVVLEAKEAGLPSVIFSSGGLPELVRHGLDGFICAENTASALAEALVAYAENPTLTIAQGRAANESLERLGNSRFAEDWRSCLDLAR